MYVLKKILATIVCGAISTTAFSSAVEIHGVKIEDSIAVAGAKLDLNGYGTRYKGPFKIYVCELYTTKKITSFEELLAVPGPKRLSMTFVREIEAGPFGRLLTRGVEDNVPKTQVSKLVPGLIRLGEMFAANKVLKVGDTLILDWIPGVGMVVTAKGVVQGDPFKEVEFYKAIMSMWFGQVPADWRLKDALLGIQS